MTVKVFIGRARAKARHADEDAVGADDLVPAHADRGFAADVHGLRRP